MREQIRATDYAAEISAIDAAIVRLETALADLDRLALALPPSVSALQAELRAVRDRRIALALAFKAERLGRK